MYKAQYSGLDRALHKLAFSSWGLQGALSDMEDTLYKSRLSGIDAARPVFITALPRAGTTLLLDMLADTGEFSTHTYRHMPFLLCPMMWSNFSRRFRQSGQTRERAHGDGVEVSEDSPEAFEEVIWRLYWKRYYKSDFIEPWGKVRHPAFEKFFAAHMRKIIAIGSGDGNDNARRYLSKNNGNIARTQYVKRAFPDSVILVLFRDPYEHAHSLLRQHLNFLQQHEEDDFSRRYMEGIGHYDFGANLKPVNFGNWTGTGDAQQATGLDYWLRYWYACYSHLLSESRQSVSFYSFDSLCDNPTPALQRIAQETGLADPGSLLSQSDRISAPRPAGADIESVDPALRAQVDALLQNLHEAASFPRE